MTSLSGVQTRSLTKHSVFGFSQELVRNKLPTKEEVFKAYLWVRAQQLEQESQVKTINGLIKIVAEQVITIWEKASIPTIPFPSILAQLKKTVKKGEKLQYSFFISYYK